MQRDACGLDARVVVSDGRITGLRTTAGDECKVEVTGLELALPEAEVERYGPDVTTGWWVAPHERSVLAAATPVAW
jgi:hypothetical protein